MKNILDKIKELFKNKKFLIGFGIVIFIILALVMFLIFKDNDPDKPSNNNNNNEVVQKEIKYDSFVIKDHKGELKDYDKTLYYEGYEGSYEKAYYIDGAIVNNGNKTYKGVIVKFNLFDKNGKILGVATTVINEMKKGVEYKFKAMSLTKDEVAKKVVRYDLKTIIY